MPYCGNNNSFNKKKMKKKTLYVIAGASALGIGLYFFIRRPSYRFVDNVWCVDDACSNIDIPEYIEDALDGEGVGTSISGSEVDGRSLRLLLEKESNLKAGDEVFIEQDENAVHSSYNGRHEVTNIFANGLIVEIDTQRMGSSGYVGGTISKKSLFDTYF